MNIIEQIEELAHRHPFRPFTIRVAGGSKHRIKHPDFIGISPKKKTIVVWTEKDVAILVNPNLIAEVAEHSAAA